MRVYVILKKIYRAICVSMNSRNKFKYGLIMKYILMESRASYEKPIKYAN